MSKEDMTKDLTPETETEQRQEENNTNQEKLFTQEEVNKIVQERVKRQQEQDERKTEEMVNAKLSEQKTELDKQKNYLDCKEYLFVKNYPLEYLEILDTSDVEQFKEKADKAVGLNQNVLPLRSTEPENMYGDEVRDAFKNDNHIPKYRDFY